MAELPIHSNLAIAAGATFIPVCSIMVVLRVYARRLQGLRLGMDDWTIIVALVFVIGMASTIITEVGLHRLGYAAPAPEEGQPDADVAFWPVELVQVPALGLVKLSFIFLYRRIFTKQAAVKFHWITSFMIVIIAAWTIGFFFAILFICKTDFSAYWASPLVELATCGNAVILHNAFSISDVVTDIIVILLPIPMIWQLHLTTGRKIGLTAIFGLGAITIATSVVRMVIFLQATALLYNSQVDFEYLCTAGLYWSMIESGLGLCAACLPAQYSLIRTGVLNHAVKSVMSALTFRSTSQSPSAHGSDDTSANIYSKMPREPSQSSEANFATHAEKPAVSEPGLELGSVPKENAIMVTRGWETSGSMV